MSNPYRETEVAVAEPEVRPSRLQRVGPYLFALGAIAVFSLSWDDRSQAMIFVLVSAGIISITKYVWGVVRARRNVRLQLQWERWLTDGKGRPPR